jgi:hypothetical protein
MLHEYHVIYSVRYYLRFHIAAVGLGTYYLWIRGHYSTDNHSTLTITLEHVLANNYCVNVLQLCTNQNLKLINCKHQSSRNCSLPYSQQHTAGLHPQPVICCPHATGYSTFWHFRSYGLLNTEQYKLWSSSLCKFLCRKKGQLKHLFI